MRHSLLEKRGGKEAEFCLASLQDVDSLNRLKTTIQNLAGTDPATQNATTGYTYDTRDNLPQVTDPDGFNTNYTYNGLNNLTALDRARLLSRAVVGGR